MKRLFSVCLAFVCAAISFAGTDKSLFVTFTDNNTVEFALAEAPVVTVSDNLLVVSTTSATASYPLQQVRMLTYGNPTAVPAVPVSGVSITSNRVVFSGTGLQICVFALDGSRVKTNPVVSNGFTIVPLDGLSRGIYFISLNGKSFKILRK